MRHLKGVIVRESDYRYAQRTSASIATLRLCGDPTINLYFSTIDFCNMSGMFAARPCFVISNAKSVELVWKKLFMSTTGRDLLKSFELLPDDEKREVASEILRRTFASTAELDDSQLAALYVEFSEADRKLAEEGIENYERGLVVEDTE
jgi:hypothetical protein